MFYLVVMISYFACFVNTFLDLSYPNFYFGVNSTIDKEAKISYEMQINKNGYTKTQH